MEEEWWGSVLKGECLHLVPRGQDGVEVKSAIDLVLVKKDMLSYLQVVRRMGQGLPDHYILCTFR